MEFKTIAWSLLGVLQYTVIDAKFRLEVFVDVRIVQVCIIILYFLVICRCSVDSIGTDREGIGCCNTRYSVRGGYCVVD